MSPEGFGDLIAGERFRVGLPELGENMPFMKREGGGNIDVTENNLILIDFKLILALLVNNSLEKSREVALGINKTKGGKFGDRWCGSNWRV